MGTGRLISLAALCSTVGVAACSRGGPDGRQIQAVPGGLHAGPEARGTDVFNADVLRAVRAFVAWPRLTRTPQWAPAMCTFYPPAWATSHISASADESTHGQKLYHLYAMDSASYFKQTGLFTWEPGKGDPTPIEGLEQVLVKDSFRPVAAANWYEEESRPNAPQPAGAEGAAGGARQRPTEEGWKNSAYDGGTRYVAGEALGRYVMIKYADVAGAARPGTDAGWVYATVGTDGRIVQAGKIESCIACHRSAPHGRLFGLSSPGRPNGWEWGMQVAPALTPKGAEGTGAGAPRR